MSDWYVKVEDLDKVHFFANIDEDNTILQVIALDKEKCSNLDYPESEEKGKEYISQIGLPGTWIQTSYQTENNAAYINLSGAKVEKNTNKIIPNQPYPSWVYNEEKNRWYAPISHPDDHNIYLWDEENQCWYEDYEVE